VIDDGFRVRESMESAGYTPLLFLSAEEFLEPGALIVIACLITDVRMQGNSGIELQHRIRLERPELPVIFISAHYEDDTRSGHPTRALSSLI
jgi:FixJ family two-component response regulator